METSSDLFLRRLLAEILHLHRLPKVQVERIIGPVLGLFLRDLLGALVDGAPDGSGFSVVAPEFPLKRRENDQSTNVDWLAVHGGRGLVVLLELKTAPGSIEREQLDIYEAVRARVLRDGGAFLLDELRTIARASSQRAKYNALLDECAHHEPALTAARSAVTVCLVPAGASMPDTGAPRIVRHFRDLPTAIGGELAEAWPLVREALCALDLPAPVRGASSAGPMTPATFARHVLTNLRARGEARTPVLFWIGSTGTGQTPNYQVQFSDGSVQTYHHGGTPHAAGSFHPSRMEGPFPLPSAAP